MGNLPEEDGYGGLVGCAWRDVVPGGTGGSGWGRCAVSILRPDGKPVGQHGAPVTPPHSATRPAAVRTPRRLATGICAGSGMVSWALHVYLPRPQRRRRVPTCERVMIRIVQGLDRLWLNVSGIRCMEITAATEIPTAGV